MILNVLCLLRLGRVRLHICVMRCIKLKASLTQRGVLRISSDRDDQTIFLHRKILASIFWVFKTNVSFFRVTSVNAFWKFLWLGNSAWDSWGVKVWSRDVFGFCLKP